MSEPFRELLIFPKHASWLDKYLIYYENNSPYIDFQYSVSLCFVYSAGLIFYLLLK